MLRIVAELDPEAAAFYRAAVRARTNPKRPATPTDGGNVIDLGARRAAKQPTAMEARVAAFIGGGKSQLLDQGESKRVFTKAQRYALLASYSGCAFPGCEIPSSMLEFHHIGRWAERHDHQHGTDLQNGSPLCGFHNRLMEEGWDIRFDPVGIPWFIPPAVLDPARRPLRAGNLIGREAA